jgi:hypothetical protein
MQVDPHAMDASQVDELRKHMTPAVVLGFASALYLLDAYVRALTVVVQLAGPGSEQ